MSSTGPILGGQADGKCALDLGRQHYPYRYAVDWSETLLPNYYNGKWKWTWKSSKFNMPSMHIKKEKTVDVHACTLNNCTGHFVQSTATCTRRSVCKVGTVWCVYACTVYIHDLPVNAFRIFYKRFTCYTCSVSRCLRSTFLQMQFYNITHCQ